MDSSSFRTGLTKPFAQNAEDITSIPDQKPGFGRASFSGGFPHETSVAIADGGIPPFLPDMNGALRDISNPIFLMSCGMPVIFNTDFAAAIGGYPKGAVVWRDGRAYVSNIENNSLDTSNTNAWSLRTPPAAATIDQNNSVDYLTGALLAPEISDILSKISSITIPQAASQDEVNAGQNGDKFVTPSLLANWVSDDHNFTPGDNQSSYHLCLGKLILNMGHTNYTDETGIITQPLSKPLKNMVLTCGAVNDCGNTLPKFSAAASMSSDGSSIIIASQPISSHTSLNGASSWFWAFGL